MSEAHAAPDPSGGHRRLLVYGVESGIVGQHGLFTGYGSLWMPWERRGDFMRILREVRLAHAYSGPIDLSHLKTDAEAFALALIDEVFQRRWLSYRCLIAKGHVDTESDPRAFTRLIAQRLLTLPGGLADRELRLRVTKNARTAGPNGDRTIDQLERLLVDRVPAPPTFDRSLRAARSAEPLEVVELLTSLVVSDWERRPTTVYRKKLSLRAAENLGWSDLAADTQPSEWKFNIWYLPDPRAEAASESTQRSVQLRLPLID